MRGWLDRWVPASSGHLLRQRLGRPAQLLHLGGHKTLFYFLPTQETRIASWLERAVAE